VEHHHCNDTANHGQITFNKYSDGSISVSGYWYRGAAVQGVVSSGTATLVDTVFSIAEQGMATDPTARVGYQNSAFIDSVSGIARNGKSSGTYGIFFSTYGWPSNLQGIFTATKISGSGITVSVKEVTSAIVPETFSLFQNYPNPFNPVTTISFNLPTKSFVSLKVFDILGRKVATIVSEEISAGVFSRQWNASALSSGVYFYSLQAGSFTETKKLVLLK
jgi:Secretion system C-terminal sorting domain